MAKSADKDPYAGREKRFFWCITEAHRVVLAAGYWTPNEGVWWVPDVGYSGWVGTSLFITKREAVEQAMKKVDVLLVNLRKIKRELESEVV